MPNYFIRSLILIASLFAERFEASLFLVRLWEHLMTHVVTSAFPVQFDMMHVWG